ncbi:MAG: RtcB family protein [Cellulosilyticaceae bacterium]
MFVIYEEGKTTKPIKVWLQDKEAIDANCLAQAINLSNLPFIHQWVALMPDTHAGKGMPIGGVIATEGVVIPHAVGSDIGCGMIFVQTDVEAHKLKEVMTPNGSLLHAIIGSSTRDIPVGHRHHSKMQPSVVLEEAVGNLEKYTGAPTLLPQIEDAFYQMGTLGGGNHFIEFQEDEEGKVCIMIHTGSRHLGSIIGEYFHGIARELNRNWYSGVPEAYNLAFLPVQSQEGRLYIEYMNLALDFAEENREVILQKIMANFTRHIEKYLDHTVTYTDKLNVHHNYAALENHYGKNVWVHRKGAIRARDGEKGIIPGAMGSYSYIVEGKGNEESFQSCSHGAGRVYSRTRAKELYSVEAVMCDLKAEGVVLGKSRKKDVAEECRFAYKDIDQVIANQRDLVSPLKKLKTLGVIKG